MATPTKSNLVTNLRELINKRQLKQVNFMGSKIEVNKLTLAECTEIQTFAQKVNAENPEAGLELIREIVRVGVPAASDFTDEDFSAFPMDDLTKLSDEVLKYAGMDPKAR